MVVKLGEEYVFCMNLRVDGRAATMAVETKHWGHYWTYIPSRTARWDDTDEQFPLDEDNLKGLSQAVARHVAEQYAEVIRTSRAKPAIWN